MRQGFSLVELSIVLVILGLLTGGILAGQSLIRASELRAVTSEYTRYNTSVRTFRDKYLAVPGDMANAINFWGAAHATPATCVTTASTTATCNGDGNGNIAANETFRFWQQLANAGLIEGSYDGITHGSTSYSSTSANSPSSRISTALWFAWYWGTAYAPAGTGNLFGVDYGNFFLVGIPTANTFPATSIMKPEEMWNLDTKLDDGKPASGQVIAYNWATCTDASSGSVLTASYALTSTSVGCLPIFAKQF